MTKTQLRHAARLYAYASIAHLDAGGASSEEEAAVMREAVQFATDKLALVGVAPADVVTLADCIRIAKS